VTAPSVLLFDFGGTLDAEGIPWKERFHRLFEEEAREELPAARFDPAFYAADDALVGTIPRELPFRETVARLSESVARGLALADSGAANRVAGRFTREALERLAASERLLSELSGRYRLGVVSNFYGNLERVCADAGIAPHLSAAIDSVAVGFEKPDPRIFRAALERLHAEPAEALFVGDSLPRDMAGARALGMPHVWLSPEKREACCPEDSVIDRLARLPEVLP
jgi:putative hydrolase of the HAD superfamily